MLTPHQLEQLTHFLSAHQHICLATHVRPDADAVGSTVALGLSLASAGKRVTCFDQDPVPQYLQFLPHADRMTASLADAKGIDAIILVDCGKPSRAGETITQLAQKLPVMIIDHHIPEMGDTSQFAIDQTAAATAVLIAQILEHWRMRLTPDVATLLYCGLVGDTGGFRYSNTTPAVFALAARLVDAGADPWRIASEISEQRSPIMLHLLRLCLETLELCEQGRVATLALTQEMLAEARALPEHAEDFVSYARSLAGVEVAVLMRELDDGTWKVSLRSKHVIDVAAISAKFSGGGHKHAAGCTFDGPLANVKRRLLPALADAFKRLRGTTATDARVLKTA